MATSRSNILFLCLLTTLLYIFALGARDFWAPVEPRYAEIARVMFIKGEWILPTVNGSLYTDKPILYFWLVLIASKIYGGVNEWTVRLPAAIGGIGFVITTFLIGRDFFSARAGFYGAIVLATSMRVVWESRWAHVDTLFCCFFALSIYFGARTLLREGKSYQILLAYAFMALAVLTKGLIGVVLPGLLFLAFVLAQRDWRLISAAKLPLGIPIFLLIATPWFYLVHQATGGKWLSDFIYIHHIQRYTAGAGHRQPLYYYFTTLPVDFLPWTIYLLAALFGFRSYRQAWSDPVTRFFVLWFLVVLVFFNLSDTKRDLYLMPLLPVLALLVGDYLVKLESKSVPHSSLYRWLVTSFFVVVAVAGVALPSAAWIFRREVFWLLLPPSAALAFGGISVVALVRLRRPGRVLAAVASLMTLSVITASFWIVPYLERFKSHRRFSQEIKKIVPLSSPLFVYADTMNDFNFYLEREAIPVISSPLSVDNLIGRSESRYILVKERDLKKLPQLAREWIVASES
ncbi:MAG TPA: glycosyltransferase family 39 protein, partial [Candidatus Binatia bacterium]|nr:glycosyltransferase family 39 protein [Candidatus Binatia bacterium]